jgi:hypothetical protein
LGSLSTLDVDVLLQYQANSLLSLKVSSECDDIVRRFYDLHKFPSLRRLQTSYDLLTDLQDIDQDDAKLLLPISIEHLRFAEGQNLDGRSMAESIRNLVSHKPALFPNLSKLEVCFCELTYDDENGNEISPHIEEGELVKAACENVNIRCTTYIDPNPEVFDFCDVDKHNFVAVEDDDA